MEVDSEECSPSEARSSQGGPSLPGSGACFVCGHRRDGWDVHCALLGAPRLQREPTVSDAAFCEARSILRAAFGAMTLTRSRAERLAEIRPPAHCREGERRWRG